MSDQFSAFVPMILGALTGVLIAVFIRLKNVEKRVDELEIKNE